MSGVRRVNTAEPQLSCLHTAAAAVMFQSLTLTSTDFHSPCCFCSSSPEHGVVPPASLTSLDITEQRDSSFTKFIPNFII